MITTAINDKSLPPFLHSIALSGLARLRLALGDRAGAQQLFAQAEAVATATDMEMATGVGPESPSYSAGSLALVTITGPLTASWDRRRVELFAPTSSTVATPGNLVFPRQQSPQSRVELGLGFSPGS